MTAPVEVVGRSARTDARAQRRRQPAVVGWVVAIVLALVAGYVVGDGPGSSTSRPASDGAAAHRAGTVAVGHPQSRAGAMAAAGDYSSALAVAVYEGDRVLAATQAETFTIDGARTVGQRVRRMARTARAAAALAAGSREVAAPVVRHVPVGLRLLRYSDVRAVVAVWSVDLAAFADGSAARALWMTERLTLTWERSRWRISSARVAAGPVPKTIQRQPSSASTLVEQLHDTTAPRYAG